MPKVEDRDDLTSEMVRDHLVKHGLETIKPRKASFRDKRYETINTAVVQIMTTLGLDVMDESLQLTPQRVAKMYIEEIFYGLDYNNFPSISTFPNTMKIDEMIVERCQVRSTCEHHLVPFLGEAWVAYIPGNRIIGLSKFDRVVDFFSRRPQVQERLTAQISSVLQLALNTKDVAVVLKCEHFCIKIRGVQNPNGLTVTSKMSGKFFTNPAARGEFLALTNNH